jgi:hypothetical protein
MTVAFYPLYPFLIKACKIIFLNHAAVCGLALSNLFSLVAIAFFYLLVKKMFDQKTAFIAGIMFLAFPTAFFMSLIYTEALFLMLVLIFFYCLYARKPFGGVIAAFLLPLSRAQGILMALPLIVFMIFRFLKKDRKGLIWDSVFLFTLIAGFAVYLFWMKNATGSYFSGFEAQKGFIGNNSFVNLFNLPGWFSRNFIGIELTFHDYTTSIIERVFLIVYILLLIPMRKDVDKTLFSYALVIGLVPVLSGSLMSFSRYMLMVFPIFIVLSRRLKDNFYYLAILSFAVQIVFSVAHSLNYWVG